MNVLLDIEILAWLLIGLGALELLPALAAVATGEAPGAYIAGALPALLFGIPLRLSVRATDRRMRPRDGFVVVVAAWLMVSVFGALPYWTTGTLGLEDAFFESASGFTTTGSTTMTDIEAGTHAVLLWRSLTQWVGGMGIIVLAVAVLPLLGIGGMQLFQAEVPGPVAGKLTPRIAETARRLYMIYLGLTVLAALAYAGAGMDAFDAICHALTTVSTGGFSTRNASIAAWHSPLLEWLVVLFMLASGMNFVLHYRLLMGRGREVLRDEELRYYLGGALVVTGAVALSLSGAAGEGSPLRDGAFQTVSLLTTTGYGSADYERWPALAQLLLFMLLAVGGMAGSTAGGIKTLRLVIGFRALARMVRLLPHREGLQSVRYGARPVSERVVVGTLVFILAYVGLVGLQATAVAAAGYDIATALSAAATAVGNVGPGTGAVGPTEHFAHMPGWVKVTLGLSMIAGRLEILTVAALLVPGFWRR